MITIETSRTVGSAQTIAAEVLGYQPGVSQAGRLGTELTFAALEPATRDALVEALGADGSDVVVTEP